LIQSHEKITGAQIYLAGTFSSRTDIAALVRASGARLLTRPPAAQLPGVRAAAAKKALLLWDVDHRPRPVLGQTNLRLEWLLDSISRFEVQPLDGALYKI
jgi:hypothetical protein